MIIHLSRDEKFIDGFIRKQKKYFPQIENKYFAISKSNSFKHIESQDVEQFDKSLTYSKVLDFFKKKPRAFVLHGLNRHYLNLINSIPKEIPLIWIFYGTEIFSRGENDIPFLGPITKKNTHPSTKVWLYRKMQYFTYHFENWLDIKASPFLKAIHRIDYMAHWIKEDFEFTVKRYGLNNLRFINFCYSNDTPQIDTENCLKENLLIGHSAAWTNNHLDIINELPYSFIDRFKNIIIPLSYGSTYAYVRAVKQAALNKFGVKTVFLDTFVDKKVYFKILAGVKLAIMPSYRSQGGGNIRFFLKNRIDLALYEQNNIFKFYKQHDAKIHSIEYLKSRDFSFLSSEDHNRNRKVVTYLFAEGKVKFYYRNLFYVHNESLF